LLPTVVAAALGYGVWRRQEAQIEARRREAAATAIFIELPSLFEQMRQPHNEGRAASTETALVVDGIDATGAERLLFDPVTAALLAIVRGHAQDIETTWSQAQSRATVGPQAHEAVRVSAAVIGQYIPELRRRLLLEGGVEPQPERPTLPGADGIPERSRGDGFV
jgi:hypothetical protein